VTVCGDSPAHVAQVHVFSRLTGITPDVDQKLMSRD